MASAAQQVSLGPFIGGLNTKSDQSALADNELYVCENFEIDFDGSLRSRPAIINNATPLALNTTAGYAYPLGYHRLANGTLYLIVSDNATKTWAFDGATWTTISSTLGAAAAQMFNGKLWLLATPLSGQSGGSWDGTTYTADANMPRGNVIATYKGLLYIGAGFGAAAPTRLYYSNPITGTLWPVAQNFVDVGYGDGQGIQQLVATNSQLLVFRSNSIWSYGWSASPAAASITPLDSATGLDNALALDQFEGIIYFIYEQRAYSFQNGRAQQLNERVPLAAAAGLNGYDRPVTVSVFGNRILFSFYDTIYVYSTDTFTWTTWKSPTFGGIGKLYQRSRTAGAVPTVFGFSSLSVPTGAGRQAALLRMSEGYDTLAGETFTCTFVTKVFDYGTVSQYKRLFWWGLDALLRSQVAATVIPVSFQSSVTWGQLLAGKTWGSVLSNTWGQPATAALSVTSNRGAAGTGPQRKFIKMAKSLRFRQAYYRLVFNTDGTSATAPVKVFGLTTFIRIGERSSKTVT